MLFEEVKKVVSLDEHVAEFGVGDRQCRILYSFFDGFFGDHRVDGDELSDFAEEFEVVHPLIEIIVVDHLIIEFDIVGLFDVFQKILELMIDALLVVSELFLIKKEPLGFFGSGITDHSGSTAHEEIALVTVSHKVYRCHHGKHISYLKRISRRIETDVKFLSSLLTKVEDFITGELIYQTA